MSVFRYSATRRLITSHTPTELVTNGGFDTDTDWTKGTGWAIGSGVATKTAGTGSDLEQDISVTSGLTYTVTYTISGYTGGTLTPKIGGTAGTAISANGDYSENIAAGSGGSPRLEFTADASFGGSIDGVSVQLGTNEYTLYSDCHQIDLGDRESIQESVSLDLSNVETFYLGRYETYQVLTDIITETELTQWREFIASTAGQEQFVFDAYGNSSGADNEVSVIRIGQASINRLHAKQYQIGFLMREV